MTGRSKRYQRFAATLLAVAFVAMAACFLTACQSKAELPTAPSDQSERLSNGASASGKTSSASVSTSAKSASSSSATASASSASSAIATASGVTRIATTSEATQEMTLAKVAYLTPADGVDTDAHSQAVWEGVQSFVTKKNLTAVNLAPAEDTDAARKDAVTRAIADGANVIVCSGNEYGTVIAGLVKDNPKVRFLLTDAGMKDSSGKAAVADNVATITYHEEQAGYLAGYALVAGGYYDIGLAAGEQTPSQLRYGYGFLQGIDDAAANLNVADKIYVTYWYANASTASTESYDEIAHWYSTGTRAVFCCEGGIVQNVLDAAATADGGRAIDVETGSGGVSDVLLTSATVDMSGMVDDALTKLADAKGKWPSDLSAKTVNYGVAENMIGLSTDNWRFDSYSTDDYRALYDAFKGDTARVSSDITARPTVSVQVRWKNEPAEG